MLVLRDLVKVYRRLRHRSARRLALDRQGHVRSARPQRRGQVDADEDRRRLLEPTSGTVELDGVDVTAKPEHVRARSVICRRTSASTRT
jgi:hypothetical protein